MKKPAFSRGYPNGEVGEAAAPYKLVEHDRRDLNASGSTEQLEDEDGVQQDIQNHRHAADGGAQVDSVAILHKGQVNLRNSGQQIGQANPP